MSHVNVHNGLSLLSSLVVLVGCGDTVNLGGGRVGPEIPRGARCSGSPIVSESVRVTRQSELADLAGCEEIDGDLQIEVFAGADLSPLAALRVVEGRLALGAFPEFAELGFDDAALEALRQQVDQIAADGYLPSLAGLESLERVGSLDLSYLAAESLEPLLGLRELEGRVDSTLEGYLSIHTTRLRSLHGLQNIEGIQHLGLIENFELESLAGIQLGLSVGIIEVSDSPRLTALDELGAIGGMSLLNLTNLGITDLDSLTNLSNVASSILIWRNPNLVNVDRLADVRTSSVAINENALLRSIPSLRQMHSLESFSALRNPELESITIDLPAGASGPDTFQETRLVDPIKILEIGRNAKLTHVSLTAGLEAGRFLGIYDNPSLESVALGTLTRVEELRITRNPKLVNVDLGALRSVQWLVVLNNASLVTTELGALETFDRLFGRNAEEPVASP